MKTVTLYTDGSAIQIIQMQSQGAQVGMDLGAPEQDRGKQCVQGCFLVAHGAHHLEAETALLEAIVVEAVQFDAVCQSEGLNHKVLLYVEVQAGCLNGDQGFSAAVT